MAFISRVNSIKEKVPEVERESTIGDKTTKETRYFISLLQVDAKVFQRLFVVIGALRTTYTGVWTGPLEEMEAVFVIPQLA